ncbi:MAG TPA: MFS transporter [Candidatus Limnocylindrales bacterium]|nr:MFS transporter [Candidatus Limnocylindrales bacterium]
MPEPMTADARAATASPAVLPVAVIGGLFIASLAMRPQILAIGPLLPLIRADLQLPAGIAGLLTTIPVLCMGICAPIGPRIAARIGPATAFAACLAVIVGFGVARTFAPSVLSLLLATLAIGIGIGSAGAIPSMIVAQRMPSRPALGTGAYAGGIVAGSTLASSLAVPLAVDDEWRQALLVVSLVSIGSLLAWLTLVGIGRRDRVTGEVARRLPYRDATAWLLVVVFGLQSVLFYGVVAWLPNAFVERGWDEATAGALIGVFNGIGLITTVGLPLVADRLGSRRRQLVASSVVAVGGLLAIIAAPDLAFLWIAVLGLALGAVFPLVLTLPLDVTDDPTRVGSVAALMLFGGYVLSSAGPVLLGAARDVTGDFGASEWMLVAIAVVLVASCVTLSPDRLRRGIHRAPVA